MGLEELVSGDVVDGSNEVVSLYTLRVETRLVDSVWSHVNVKYV
jgi:hypothetical protein